MKEDESVDKPGGLTYGCWDDGALRAYCDRELPQEDLTRVAAHLGECPECHARYNEVAARAARVTSMMNALAAPAVVARARPAARRRLVWVKPLAGAALALAAAVALAFVLMPKRAAVPATPVARPHVQKPARPIQAGVEAPKTVAPEKAAHGKPARRTKPAHSEEFLALDDDPIDMGVVMRVALDGDAAVQADVIFDADGRPRAIRPVSSGK